MKSRPLSNLSKYLVICLLLLFLTPLIFGCSGSDGAAGAKGADGVAGADGAAGKDGTDATSYGTVTGTVKNLYGSAVAGVAITVSPAVEGVTVAPTDADGKYTATLPNGAYTLSFAKSGYTTQPQAANAVATKSKTLDIFLEATGPFAVNAGADVTKAAGASFDLAGTVTAFDSTLGTPTYAWSIVPDVNGTTGDVTIANGTTLTPTITMKSAAAYKAQLVEKNAGFNYALPTPVALERWRVVPLTVGVLRQPAQGVMTAAVLRLTVTYPGRTPLKDDVKIGVTLPVVPNNGLRNVPIGQPVLLQGITKATYAWTMTKPTGSAATLNDATTRYPDFTPDASGVYTISEAGTARITINAGKYVGMLTGPNQPSAGCNSTSGCHTTFNAATRMATWLDTGHKNVMIEGMKELPPGGHYAATCAPCHTTGTKYATTTINSNSFADLSVSETDADGKTLFTWFNDNHVQGNPNIETLVAARFPRTYRLSGIQCEVCHGPNDESGAHATFTAANALTATARIDYSSNSCGFCHGRPTSHAAFTQWATSGHGNYELAEGEGTSSRTGCAGCHSAQGFFLLKAQLADGTGNRTIALPAGQAAWGTDAVEPITCIVCHDPHDEGNLMVSEEVPIRISGNTDMLPAGFMASGVGRGAQCIFCHNSRNGGVTGGTATLHEDGNATFGTNMSTTANSYAAPHAASQGDVLMGRNAYFFQLGPTYPIVGERSKHSYIADSCVECHMALSTAPSTIGSSSRPDHTFGNTVAEVCGDCHGGFTSEQTMTGFDYQLGVLSQEIANAVYRIKNGVNPPAGTTVSFTAGRSVAIKINGVSTALHTTANTGYLDGVGGLTLGYDPTIAKLNWNYELLNTGAGRGTHNPGFSQRVLDASLAAAKAR